MVLTRSTVKNLHTSLVLNVGILGFLFTALVKQELTKKRVTTLDTFNGTLKVIIGHFTQINQP
jgi:hypothetical protein